MLQRLAVSAQIGVDRSQIGLLQIGTLLIAADLPCCQQQPGIFRPIGGRIRQVQRRTDEPAGSYGVTALFGIARSGQMVFGGEIIGDMGVAQKIGLLGNPGQFPVLHKCQKVLAPRFGTVFHTRRCRNHIA